MQQLSLRRFCQQRGSIHVCPSSFVVASVGFRCNNQLRTITSVGWSCDDVVENSQKEA